MQFSLMLPAETVFGWGQFGAVGERARRFGTIVALARGGDSFERSGLRERTLSLLAAEGISVIELPPQVREPEPEDIDAAVAVAQQGGIQAVVAIGGGSVLDLGKAVAALTAQQPPLPVRAYLEDIGEGRVLTAAPLPLLAIPTTAGTGTEATKNAVISSQREGFKKSLRDPRMIPDLALIDPELTVSLPPHLTAWTGLDTLTQLIEAYTSARAQPVTDALALRGLAAARALPDAVAFGDHRQAREAMSFAAYLSGICLANAGLGAAHAIAAAFGSMAPIGHGLACAIALPWVMAANLPVAAERYAHIAEVLTDDRFLDCDTAAHAAVRHVWWLLNTLGIPRAGDIPELAAILTEAQLPALAARCHGNSLRGNPRVLDDADLITILRKLRDDERPFSL